MLDELLDVIDEAKHGGQARLVTEIECAVMKKNRKLAKDRWKEQEDCRRDERMQITHRKAVEPAFKKIGKPLMFRSTPADEASKRVSKPFCKGKPDEDVEISSVLSTAESQR